MRSIDIIAPSPGHAREHADASSIAILSSMAALSFEALGASCSMPRRGCRGSLAAAGKQHVIHPLRVDV